MNFELPVPNDCLIHHPTRPFHCVWILQPKTFRKCLFLNPELQFILQESNFHNQPQHKRMKKMIGKIKKKFRINLIKPCKSLKLVISYGSYLAKRCTCQYHGIRYLVSPEMEFGNKYQSILGRLNVRQSVTKRSRTDD